MASTFDFLNPLAYYVTRFTKEQLQDITDWFEENAKPLLTINEGEPQNVVSIEQLQAFLGLKKFHRRSFHYPSYAEIMKAAEHLKAGVTRLLLKDQLLYMLDKWIVEPDMKHEIKLAFKVFDTENRDFLEMEEINAIVTTYGDAFTEAEAIEFIRDANVRGDGNIFYNDFVDSMFTVAPELYEMKKEYLYEDPDEDPSVPPLPPEPVEEPPPPPVEVPPTPPPPPSKKDKKDDKKGKKK